MNEFIFNGKSSKDYGLIVNTLPPIVKPPIRTEKIEIDGRNGDIINNLGYMAYDKEITVTRIDGNIDINSIIKWLNYSELGTLVLSNEPSLYYKAQIVERIDFTRLENFEQVKIKFHVQPFKYKYPIEKATLPRGEASGANVQVENGKTTKLVIEGKSTQETRSGKNLYNNAEVIASSDASISKSSTGFTATRTSSSTGDLFVASYEKQLKANTTYTLYENRTNSSTCYFYSDKLFGTALTRNIVKGTDDVIIYTFTTDSTGKVVVGFYSANQTQGDTVTLSNIMILEGEYSSEKIPEYELYGSSPSPEFPSEIQSVTSPVIIKTEGKNYLNVPSEYKVNGTIFDVPLSLKAGTYILSAEDIVSNSENWSNSAVIFYSNDGKQYYFELGGQYLKTREITFDKDIVKYNIYSGNDWSSSQGVTTTFTNLMISKNGGKYELYKESITVSIPLLHDMRSLPNGTRDRIYWQDGKWYDEQRVERVTLNGSESWGTYTSGTHLNGIVFTKLISDMKITYNANILRSNKFMYKQDGHYGDEIGISTAGNGYLYINILRTLLETEDIAGFKTWLSNNNVEVIYELAEPIVTEITDEVEALELFDGVNNISNSADANMIIDYVDNKLTLNNEGNHFSKPIFTITGSGTIEFIVNGNKLFSYTFPDGEDTVVIDSQKQDAYLGTVLKNRNMSGEFPTLEIGENIITWNGNITNIEILSQSRWL